MMKPSPSAPKAAKRGAVAGAKAQKAAPAMESREAPGVGASHLGGATAELASQHPGQHYDHGPHHGKDHHKRHSPVDMSKVKC